jgi:large subunit ribosomal protein L4
MKLKLFSLTAKPSTVTVSDEVFGGDLNLELIAQAVHIYRSNQRQGGAKALTRGEVSRTGAKWFKQKGTGNARHGARTAPQFVGGGVAHGPTGAENWKRALPKQMAKKALIAALSVQAQEKNLSVFADIADIAAKTKDAQSVVKSLGATGNILVVIDQTHDNVLRAFGNVDNVSVTRADRLTTYEVAAADHVVVAQPALEVLEARLVKKMNEAA